MTASNQPPLLQYADRKTGELERELRARSRGVRWRQAGRRFCVVSMFFAIPVLILVILLNPAHPAESVDEWLAAFWLMLAMAAQLLFGVISLICLAIDVLTTNFGPSTRRYWFFSLLSIVAAIALPVGRLVVHVILHPPA